MSAPLMYLPVLAGIFLAVILFSLWGIYDALFGGEEFETSFEAVSLIAGEIRRLGKEKGTLYDLGSCYGSFSLQLQKLLPHLRIIAIDNSLFRVLLSRFRACFKSQRPVFVHGNLFTVPMDDADIVNVYLPREMLPEIRRMLSAMEKRVLVTMFRTSFTDIQPLKIISLSKTDETVTLYAL